MIKCEKCLYRKNCQFLATHKNTIVEGCTAFESENDLQIKAVKEFAERFENELTQIEEIYIDEEHENFISANKVIALLVNLVKEMEGDGNE